MEPLSPDDNYEQFVELFTRNEAALRAFVRGMVPSWHDAEEVVQDVALVAWRKFDEFEIGTSFINWVCTIARFKSLSHLRKTSRDRLSFQSELIEMMADEGAEEMEVRKYELAALEQCLKKLSTKQRDLVNLAYTPGISIKDEAERVGIKPGTFYMRLNRIRAVLHDCINRVISKGEPA
ncbi:MAG: sigma-70 family RNA polymerase sigma factor [Verrucomicrobiales bacterium]|nr:sigma-70 family RNA polymerase sigma factor [Verrucomicrobiales bacterium]